SENLEVRLEAVLAPDGIEQDEECGDGVPEDDNADEKPAGSGGGRRESADRQLDAEQERDDDDTYLDEPLQPGTLVKFSPHSDLSQLRSAGKPFEALSKAGTPWRRPRVNGKTPAILAAGPPVSSLRRKAWPPWRRAAGRAR